MTATRDDLIARETRGPLVVIGHSLGGQLAAGLALAHPERVIAAVLIAPAGAGISPLKYSLVVKLQISGTGISL